MSLETHNRRWVLFGFGGTPAKTRGQLTKEELGIGFNHLMLAAVHAVGGAGAAVGPRYHTMRTRVAPAAGRMRYAASNGWVSTRGALAPLLAAAREGSREATKAALKEQAKKQKRLKKEQGMSRMRRGMIFGVLAAGATAGAAAALVARRRRNQPWQEFDPSSALEGVKSEAGGMKDKAKDLQDSAVGKAKDVKAGMEGSKGTTGDLTDTTSGTYSTSTGTGTGTGTSSNRLRG